MNSEYTLKKGFSTLAHMLIDEGHNVAVVTVGPTTNYAYVKCWNAYGQQKDEKKWVKFIDEISSDYSDKDYKVIQVGMPTSASSSSKSDSKTGTNQET